MEIEDSNFKLAKSMQLTSLITIALTQATTIIRLEMDEVVISSLVGVIDKERIFNLFSRVVATFRQLSTKEIKQICLEMVNNEEIFE